MAGAAELPFRYRSRGRSGLNIALFALAGGVFAFAAVSGAPVAVLLPIGFAVAGMAWLVARDPRGGIEIDDAAVTLRRGRRRERIPLAEIARVHVEHWSDSVDVTIHRLDGSTVEIPDRCRPALGALTRALEAAGVAVTES